MEFMGKNKPVISFMNIVVWLPISFIFVGLKYGVAILISGVFFMLQAFLYIKNDLID